MYPLPKPGTPLALPASLSDRLVFAVARQTTRFWSVYQRFAGGGFRACVYAGSAAWVGSAMLRICLGIDMPSFFSVPASSGVVLVR
jgi:hypothetical protein